MDDGKSSIDVEDPIARGLLTQYLKRREQELPTLHAALAERDFEALASTAHKLSGSGSAYGLHEITRLGGELEKAARSGQATVVGKLLGDLESFVRNLQLT